jgi:hypothetical protein
MKSTVIKLLKEIGISLLLLVVLSAVIILAFYDKIPFRKEIPEPITYKNIDLSQYGVRGDVENETAATKRYESNNSEFELFETELRYLPGKINPFSEITATTDLPTEVVGVQPNPSEDVNSGENVTEENSDLNAGQEGGTRKEINQDMPGDNNVQDGIQ